MVLSKSLSMRPHEFTIVLDGGEYFWPYEEPLFHLTSTVSGDHAWLELLELPEGHPTTIRGLEFKGAFDHPVWFVSINPDFPDLFVATRGELLSVAHEAERTRVHFSA